jgi:hypothetical protein
MDRWDCNTIDSENCAKYRITNIKVDGTYIKVSASEDFLNTYP